MTDAITRPARSRIYHSGGDILLNGQWFPPEVWAGMSEVWKDERRAAARAGNVRAFVNAVDLDNQYAIALLQRSKWMACFKSSDSIL